MYFVYILSNKKLNWFYKGMTNNLERRLLEHESGKNKSTVSYIPFELVHVEVINNRIEARKMEKFFKSGYGREIIRELVSL